MDCGNQLVTYVCVKHFLLHLYTLNLFMVLCQFYLSKARGKSLHQVLLFKFTVSKMTVIWYIPICDIQYKVSSVFLNSLKIWNILASYVFAILWSLYTRASGYVLFETESHKSGEFLMLDS